MGINMMFEGIAPKERHRGLYDEMADVLNNVRQKAEWCTECSANTCTHATFVHTLLNDMVDKLALALHRDNAHFNEARFRKRICA